MSTRELGQIQSQTDAEVDDTPVILENCYHRVIGDGERGGSLPSKFSLSGLSFRWQVGLLGTLVVILSFAVLFAIVATLQYTKSAVLNGEKRQLAETARNLAHEYEDRVDAAAPNNQQAPFDNPNLGSSREFLALLSRLVLQNKEGVGGGFYSLSDNRIVGSFYPNGAVPAENAENTEIPNAEYQAVLEIARSAAATRQHSEKVIVNPTGLLLISSMPIRRGHSVIGSAWAVKRLSDLPGANRFRAYSITAGLATAALTSVLLTLLVIRNLQGGVRKVESGLQTLEGNLSSRIDTTNEPAEIQRIVQAINRLGMTLKEKMDYEKQIESQLRHAERLASLGRLVAGVAHEVRNPLATIRLRVQMCRRDAADPKVKESCYIALEEIERLNGIVNRLLSFARPIQLQLEPVDLKRLVQERVRSFEELALERQIQLMTNIPNRNFLAVVDKDRMAQVFDNIIQNALEAMAEHGGTLSVTLASYRKENEKRPGVSVEFQDTGKGMDSTAVGHVFDPFFTTKASGTGLGLSISHELVRAHGGDIRIDSEQGRGTSVRITIPDALT
jgi:two-component system, NtrC family, sensor histidine kinase HydH